MTLYHNGAKKEKSGKHDIQHPLSSILSAENYQGGSDIIEAKYVKWII